MIITNLAPEQRFGNCDRWRNDTGNVETYEMCWRGRIGHVCWYRPSRWIPERTLRKEDE